MSEEMKDRIVHYWTARAAGYSALNREELGWETCEKWLLAMESVFPDRPKKEMRILDVGTGPGFMAILLTKAGYFPDACDCTAEMLKEARRNAGEYEDRIKLHLMNADALGFADGTFDAIVSRNLTWNLPNPCICYAEWLRVLKPGGRVVIFDANWYRYLFDEEARLGYDRDRDEVAKKAITDFNIGPNFNVMEDIARLLPMSKKHRPFWDRDKMLEVGYGRVDICEDIWTDVWTAEEKTNYASTPMFRITGMKGI
ncbi:MAG: class I SAM-dependent methyltransferase [Lachnospiraceae bacterium]|nr:class I SAM-dependent methyltransferase [Lachnospiraceae bacterium]